LAVEIKELQELIDEEKAAEEKVRRAKQEAQEILQAAHQKAESILQTFDSDPSWEKLRKAGEEEITKRKAEVEEEHKRKIAELNSAAQQNFEKAVAYVVKEALGAET
jgi:V/A-type H+-transporting ATPase subunit G/H